ncbi:MAG: porin family protein [Ferruginibacter sp.]|nr:porin family protein [Ferruginibacter sp.]
MQCFYRKQTTLILLFFAFTLSVFAQTKEATYTTVKPFTGSKEFRKFSVGLNVGALAPNIVFGGSNDFTNPQITLGYGANVRYQFSHYFAVQADFLAGKLKANNDDKLGNGANPARAITSFKTKLKYSGSLSGQLTLGNINFLREKNTIVPYLSVGAGLVAYEPRIVRAGSTTEVAYDNVTTKKEFFVPVGAGFKVNVSKLINLDLGYRMNFVDGDNFDGSSYWTTRGNSLHKDKFSYGFLGLEFALGKKSKQQLLFDNPAARTNMDLQSQIDTVKTAIEGLKNDTDADGVADMFDKEPNTPAGSPVDSHGVTKDTDSDGVPDWKDKQLITPTECQPVDADGVGKCPEPACCAEMKTLLANATMASACPTDYPSLSMKGTSLSKDVKAMLATVASKLQEKPTCTITITAYPAASKAAQSLADKKLAAIQTYLTETLGVSADRIATDKSIGGGDADVIDIK